MPRQPRTARPKKTAKKSNRRTKNVPERASLSEQRTMSVQGGFVNNTLYSLMNTSLDQFTRASIVAKGYQHYRIKYITLKVKPTWDTYAVGGANPAGKPNLYYMIDKAGAIPTNITLEGLKQMGARPHNFDEKVRVIGWRPSVLTADLTASGAAPVVQGSQYKISPWLNTSDVSVFQPWNPSTIDHLGVYWYVEAPVQAGGNQPYTCEVEVQFEFKKPLVATSVGATAAIPAGLAQLNTSKDGIVDDRPGGDDTLLPS